MKKRFWSRIVLVTGVIVAVSCMLIVLFYGSLKRQLSMERSSNLDRLSEKVCDSFNILIEGQWNQVKSGARALRTLSPDTEDGLGFTVGQLERLLGYEEGSLSLIDSKGFRYQSQGVRMRWDVLEMLAPEQPASQVLITTPGLLDEAEEQILFMYRLKEPCYTGDGAVEITHLVLMKDMVSFGEAISTKTSALGNGSSYIVNQNGTVVYHQVFCSDFGTAYNILPLLKDAQFLYEDSFEQPAGIWRRAGPGHWNSSSTGSAGLYPTTTPRSTAGISCS